MKVVVASKNPVKINSTKIGFERVFSDQEIIVEGVSAPSELSDQPMNETETLTGATNRVKNVSRLAPDADYWVGIEGGIEEINGEMEAFAWIVVASKERKIGKGRSASFILPQKMAELIRQGKELGEADDIVFNDTNSKQKNGTVGKLTRDNITRTDYYESAVILALIPFINSDLY